MRYLRDYQRLANKEHWCDRCACPIRAGEIYEGQVAVNEERKQHRMVIFKYHVSPMCDGPPDPDDGGRKNADIIKFPGSLSMAA